MAKSKINIIVICGKKGSGKSFLAKSIHEFMKTALMNGKQSNVIKSAIIVSHINAVGQGIEGIIDDINGEIMENTLAYKAFLQNIIYEYPGFVSQKGLQEACPDYHIQVINLDITAQLGSQDQPYESIDQWHVQ